MNNVLNFLKTKILIKEIVGPIVVVFVSFILYKIIKNILKKFVDLRYELGNPSKEKMLEIVNDDILRTIIETNGI